MDRGLLCKKEVRPIQREISVYLISGHLMEPLHAKSAAGVHHYSRAHDICFQKHTGILDRAIHMAFGGKIHHYIRTFLFKEAIYRLSITNICLDKAEIRVLHNGRQCGQVSRVGQLIQTDNAILGMVFQHIKDEVGANKARAASDDHGHKIIPRFT